MPRVNRKDLLGGLLILALGLGAAWQATQYDIGTLSRMGPGYFPLVLGIILAVTGTLIALASLREATDQPRPTPSPESVMAAGGIAGGLNHATQQPVMAAGGIAGGLNHATQQPVMAEGGIAAGLNHATQQTVEWRGWFCIIAGVAAFAIAGRHLGLLPATFASVFIAALGDRKNTILAAVALAALMTLVCLVVFWWMLKIQLPLFRWN